MVIVMTYGESNATGGGTPEGIEALYSEFVPLENHEVSERTGIILPS